MYGLLERQFRRYFHMAERRRASPARPCCCCSSGASTTWSTGWASRPRAPRRASSCATATSWSTAARSTSRRTCCSRARSSACARSSRAVARIVEALEQAERRGVPDWLEVQREAFQRPGQGAADPRRPDDADQREAGRRAVLEVSRSTTPTGGFTYVAATNWRDLIKPKKLDAEDKNLTATYGKFVGEPLERGFGITIGNSLRRVLLSSLQGAAITAREDRGRPARVLHAARRARGRHRHRPQPQGGPPQAASTARRRRRASRRRARARSRPATSRPARTSRSSIPSSTSPRCRRRASSTWS